MQIHCIVTCQCFVTICHYISCTVIVNCYNTVGQCYACLHCGSLIFAYYATPLPPGHVISQSNIVIINNNITDLFSVITDIMQLVIRVKDATSADRLQVVYAHPVTPCLQPCRILKIPITQTDEVWSVYLSHSLLDSLLIPIAKSI